jgi:ubiquinone/menaquinone biosynthesis C-methylase UbiE
MLTHEEAKAFYDHFGRKQDLQGLYENSAVDAVMRNGEFGGASAVLEFGCGTGRFAERLLDRHLPPGARYVGVDSSETMVSLAKGRLKRFGLRAEVLLTDGSPRLNFRTGTFDRFVSLYVLDLLTREDEQIVLGEAERLLTEGGLLAAASLTHGFTFFSRVVERLWTALHGLRPSLVGGCRPINIVELVKGPRWKVLYDARFSAFGVPSEALVAERTGVMEGVAEARAA